MRSINLRRLLFTGSFLSVICSSTAFGQPKTEVHLVPLNDDLKPSVSELRNISANEGYDNQPSFLPDGSALLYSRTMNGQTEIARYDLSSGETVRITNTLQGSEYSPTPMPDGRISSIRLDTTGLQLLYAYTADGASDVLIPDLVVGYHVWITDQSLVGFVLGDTITMQRVDVKSGEKKLLATNIGRSLHLIPGSNRFSYVDKSSSPWQIKSMDPTTGETDVLASTLEGSEDYCWTPDGTILMGQGTKIFRWEQGKEWRLLADLSSQGISGITRMCVSSTGDWLAFVADE